jgi:hypothetical protein
VAVIQALKSGIDVNAAIAIDLVDATIIGPTGSGVAMQLPSGSLAVLGGATLTASGSLDPASIVTTLGLSAPSGGLGVYIRDLSVPVSALLGLGPAPTEAAASALLIGSGATFTAGPDTAGDTIQFVGGNNIATLPSSSFGQAPNVIKGAATGQTMVVAPAMRAAATVTGDPVGTAQLGGTALDGRLLNATLNTVSSVEFEDGTLFYGTNTAGAEAFRLYQAALGRAPDPAGLGSWSYGLASGLPLVSAAQSFVNSPEFQARYGALSDPDFVTLTYKNVLGRAPDQAGYSAWTGALAGGMTRAQMVVGFSESPEFISDTSSAVYSGVWAPDPAAIEALGFYEAGLGRLPDAAGLASWIGRLHAGLSQTAIAGGFYGSTEFQSTYGALSNADYVNLLYKNTLGRSGDPAGVAAWTGALANGMSRASVLAGFATSAELVNKLLPDYANGVLASS